MKKMKLSKKAESLLFLCIVAAAALIAVAIVEHEANKNQNYGSPALVVSRERATQNAAAAKTMAKPKTGSSAK
jgi:hypothetical protein